MYLVDAAANLRREEPPLEELDVARTHDRKRAAARVRSIERREEAQAGRIADARRDYGEPVSRAGLHGRGAVGQRIAHIVPEQDQEAIAPIGDGARSEVVPDRAHGSPWQVSRGSHLNKVALIDNDARSEMALHIAHTVPLGCLGWRTSTTGTLASASRASARWR